MDWTEIAVAAVSALASVLTVAITVATPMVWRWLTRRADAVGVELTERERDLAERAALQAVRYAEEWARRRIRKTGEAPTSAEKAATARAHYMGPSVPDLDELLDAAVHEERPVGAQTTLSPAPSGYLDDDGDAL